MPYCPNCRDEFRDWVEECPDCKVQLVDELPSEKPLPDDIELVELFSAQNQVSAYAVKGRLESAGIPALIKTMDNPYYDGAMVHMRGYWGRVYVKKEDLERAAQIVEEAMAQMKDEPEE